MSLDRSITLSVVSPFYSIFGMAQAEARLPVLMYHSISTTDESGVSNYFRVCTSPVRFAEHMERLHVDGWEGVSLTEGFRRLRNPASARDGNSCRPVAITFDDGFRDFYTEAAPILQRHGFSATMYLPTHFISSARRRFKERECLTWAEIRDLHRAGFEFGSHTVHHPALIELSDKEIRRELETSKDAIEQELGTLVKTFAYPYAFPRGHPEFVRGFRQILDEAGYQTCATTLLGRVTPRSDPLMLPRLPANSADDCTLLSAKLRGAYDWVALPQRIRKIWGTSRAGSAASAESNERNRG